MNSNRGQYTSAPLYNMKNRRPAPVPQPGEEPPRAPASRRFAWLAAVLSLVLPALFLLSLLLPSDLLRWAFLALTALAVAAMWLLRAFAKSARNTLTIVYGALAVVIGLALFMGAQSPETRNASSSRADQGSLFTNTDASALSALLQSQATPEPVLSSASDAVSAAQQQLQLFLTYWAENKIPQMLELCAPSWVAQQQSPEQRLWNLILQRQPVQYQVEAVQGSDADTSRTITLKISILQNGATTVQRMQVLMFRVNDVWYVDPQSLSGTPVDEAAESANKSSVMIATTIAPTATPAPGGEAVILYYNAEGGKYYHAQPNCAAVAERYWPLTKFYYSDLNSQKFKNLLRCNKCNPPERPAN